MAEEEELMSAGRLIVDRMDAGENHGANKARKRSKSLERMARELEHWYRG